MGIQFPVHRRRNRQNNATSTATWHSRVRVNIGLVGNKLPGTHSLTNQSHLCKSQYAYIYPHTHLHCAIKRNGRLCKPNWLLIALTKRPAFVWFGSGLPQWRCRARRKHDRCDHGIALSIGHTSAERFVCYVATSARVPRTDKLEKVRTTTRHM